MGLSVAPAHAVSASLTSCAASYNSVGGLDAIVEGATDCQYVTPVNSLSNSVNSSDPIVNTLGFFGSSDWKATTEVNAPNLTGQSGTATFTADADWSEVLIVFKSGNSTSLTGFLLEDFNVGSNSVAWTTPFREPPFDFPGAGSPRDVSNYTVWYRAGSITQPIPEPTTMLGVLAAGALGAAWKRKYGQNQKIAS